LVWLRKSKEASFDLVKQAGPIVVTDGGKQTVVSLGNVEKARDPSVRSAVASLRSTTTRWDNPTPLWRVGPQLPFVKREADTVLRCGSAVTRVTGVFWVCPYGEPA
jgi:hypothetical protein